MTITTYTGEGYEDVRKLVIQIVKDLTGAGAPEYGTAANHMRLIHPETIDENPTSMNLTYILEATPEIDPFSPEENVTGPQYDPWRITFQTFSWQNRAFTELGIGSSPQNYKTPTVDGLTVASLGVYVGTPSTMTRNADNQPELAWRMSKPGAYKLPTYRGINPLDFRQYTYKTSYIGKDMIEPLGNTGAEWTNTFDPTANSVKMNDAPSPAPSSGNPPTLYQSPQTWDGPEVTDPSQLFVNKWITHGNVVTYGDQIFSPPRAVLNSYRLTLSDHGLFLGVWGPDPEEAGNGFSWLLVQRPVDKEDGIVRGLDKTTGLPYNGTQIDPDTGLPYPLGNRPLFCVNSVNGKFHKFVVREHDNPVPSTRKDASRNTIDSGAVINPYQQQSLTENGEYVITFLNNLNSSRFKYSDELDMVGTVSSDVVGGGSSIDVGVYTETQKRTYHALWSSGSFGTKMRIMVVENQPTPKNPTLPGYDGGGGSGGGGGGTTYALQASDPSADEPGSVTITLTTTGVSNGTDVPYTITGTGITAADLGLVSLTGNFTVNGNSATLTLTIANDSTTEGEESFTLSLDGITPTVSVSVTINDTSTE